MWAQNAKGKGFTLCARLPLDQGLWDLGRLPHLFTWKPLIELLFLAFKCRSPYERQNQAPATMRLKFQEETLS